MKSSYKCEKCGAEFDSQGECLDHEAGCGGSDSAVESRVSALEKRLAELEARLALLEAAPRPAHPVFVPAQPQSPYQPVFPPVWCCTVVESPDSVDKGIR